MWAAGRVRDALPRLRELDALEHRLPGLQESRRRARAEVQACAADVAEAPDRVRVARERLAGRPGAARRRSRGSRIQVVIVAVVPRLLSFRPTACPTGAGDGTRRPPFCSDVGNRADYPLAELSQGGCRVTHEHD